MDAGPLLPSNLPPGARRRGGDALVLAGGVAKGAFIAGAVLALAQSDTLRIRRIVATSSGALSAVFLASALRDGRNLAVAAAELVALWREKATVGGAFEWTPSGVARRTGLSTSAKLVALMRQYVRPARGRRPIELRLVMTNVAGEPRYVAGGETTTFEHVARFSGSAFDDERRLEDVFRAVCAASAFPLVFEPVEINVGGRPVACLDGGLVDDTPIKYAVENPFVSRVFVIAPYPAKYEAPTTPLHGAALVVHLAELAVQERLYRDLREAHATNEALARLQALVPDPRARAVLLDAMGWRHRRPIEIVEIRPEKALPGGAFDGFVRPALRDAYIDAGDEAARQWIHDRLIPRKAG